MNSNKNEQIAYNSIDTNSMFIKKNHIFISEQVQSEPQLLHHSNSDIDQKQGDENNLTFNRQSKQVISDYENSQEHNSSISISQFNNNNNENKSIKRNKLICKKTNNMSSSSQNNVSVNVNNNDRGKQSNINSSKGQNNNNSNDQYNKYVKSNKISENNLTSTNRHNNSMNQLQNMLNSNRNINLSKDSKAQKVSSIIQHQNHYYSNIQNKENILQFLPDKHQNTSTKPQIDYYTLILQLTAQLNYSRLNKQYHNQKSILKQIKNLIEYIEKSQSIVHNVISGGQNRINERQERQQLSIQNNKSNYHIRNMNQYEEQSCNNNENSNKRQVVFKSNKKSNHTFSSICSDDCLLLQKNQFHFQLQEQQEQSNQLQEKQSNQHYYSQPKITLKQVSNSQNINYQNNNVIQQNQQHSNRRIKYRIITKQQIQEQQQNEDDQHDRTFEQNQQNQQQNQHNSSIIDMVQREYQQQKQQQYPQNMRQQYQYNQYQQDKTTQNSPLSRITQHQSEYVDSMNPSLESSPRRSITPIKLFKNPLFCNNFTKQQQQINSNSNSSKLLSKNKQIQKISYNNFSDSSILPQKQYNIKQNKQKQNEQVYQYDLKNILKDMFIRKLNYFEKIIGSS